ncbi:MAG: hypothetical protein JJU23_06765 [Cyclobacteriaceae bacterium]|nr:hypothetical protein [Cyclobacteriaceae bacterium]
MKYSEQFIQYAFLVSIFLLSCSDDSRQEDLYYIQPEQKDHIIEGQVIKKGNSIFYYRKVDITIQDDFVFIIDLGPEQHPMLTVYQTTDNKFIDSFILKGEGPDQLFGISGVFFKNDSIFRYSSSEKKMLSADISDFKITKKLKFHYYSFPISGLTVEATTGLQKANDSIFVTALIPALNGRFMIFNYRMDSLYTFGKYPEIGREPNEYYHPIDRLIYVDLNLSGVKYFVNPYNQTMVCTYDYHLIEIYDIADAKLKNRITGPISDFPVKNFEIRGNEKRAYLSKDQIMAYNKASFSKNKMFIAYNGRKFNGFEESLLSRRIFVFTHDGEFLYSLNPQMDFFSFDVNEEGDKLFIIRSYEEGEAYVEFDLSEVG